MISKQVVIYGTGGHARVVADILDAEKKTLIGFVDDNPAKREKKILGYDVKDLNAYAMASGVERLVVIAVGDNRARERIVDQIASLGKVGFDTAVHPSAVIGRNVVIGLGTVIMPGVVINCDAHIGKHVILNTGASVDHDCEIGDFAHLSPGARLGGGVRVGSGSWIGIGASIINNCRIGQEAIVGMGSVVIENVPDYWVVAGNPARFIRMNREDG